MTLEGPPQHAPPAWRVAFLTFACCVALVVGSAALFFPAEFLRFKGVEPVAATQIWMRETGLLITSLGTLAWAARRSADDSFLFLFSIANLLAQIGLFSIEAAGVARGTIPSFLPITPSAAVHTLLGVGFASILMKSARSRISASSNH